MIPFLSVHLRRFIPTQSKILLLLLIAAAWMITGCTTITRWEQPQATQLFTIKPGETFGQTFTARYQGLEAFSIQLAASGSGSLQFRLYETPPFEGQESRPITESVLPVGETSETRMFTFSFSPQYQSDFHSFYAEISPQGETTISASVGPSAAYPNGAFYLGKHPQASQARFNLGYNLPVAAAGLIAEGLTWLVFLFSAGGIFILPGWALLRWAVPSWNEQDGWTKLALSAGVGLALYPALLLWLDVLHLHLGVWSVAIPVLLSAVFLFLHAFRRNGQKSSAYQAVHDPGPSHSNRISFTPALVLTIIFLLAFFIRMWMIRGLAAPMWGDSVQHTAMAKLIMLAGGLFQSWEPVAPYQSLSVQYGFSADAAAFGWMTGVDATRSVLAAGQIINTLAALALYPLAKRIAGENPWAGITAVLVAGLISPLPAFYLNWGRYAQLTGLAILPAALWLAWESAVSARLAVPVWKPPRLSPTPRWGTFRGLINRARYHPWMQQAFPPRRLRMIVLTGMVLAGMTLAYYRMPFFFSTFIALWLLAWVLQRLRLDGRAWRPVLARLALIAVAGLGFFLPWLPRLLASNLADAAQSGLSGVPLDWVRTDLSAWADLPQHLPPALLVLAGLAAVWALVRHNLFVASLPLWFAILQVYVLSQLVGVPGANMVQSFTLLIGLYIPIGLLLGWAVRELEHLLVRGLLRQDFSRLAARFPGTTLQSEVITSPTFARSISAILLSVVTLALALSAAANQRRIARPEQFALVAYPDLRAMDWIRENTAEEAVFLVESYRIYGGYTIVGADAGWWLPIFTDRGNTVPPQYALYSEKPARPGYSQELIDLVALLETAALDDPAVLQEICSLGVTHAYIGQRQGQVGFSAQQLFSEEELALSPHFSRIYAEDRVRIYAFTRSACNP